MAENNCSGSCSTCGQDCASRKAESLLEPANPASDVKRVIGVVSGKGGVGKSLVTGLLAALAARQGLSAGIMDADLTGPSIPKMFGVEGQPDATDVGILPKESAGGVKLMSINLLLEDPGDPVVWRGPVITGVVKQFWKDVSWGDLDVLFIDMPPGTGDVPLTVFQSIPLDGIVIVSTPQELVGMIVEKAVRMAGKMNIPVLGLVENMAYVACPDCGRKINIFGESRLEKDAAEHGIEATAQLPVMPDLAKLVDAGRMDEAPSEAIDPLYGVLQSALGREE